MLEWIGSWILGVTGAAMITALTQALSPEGPVKKALRLACGLLMILAVLRPVRGLSTDSLSFYTAQYAVTLDKYSEKINAANESFLRAIIADKTASYILEKADELDIVCTAQVSLKTSMQGGYPYPYSVTLEVKGELEKSKREALSKQIEAGCAIPAQRQNWHTGR